MISFQYSLKRIPKNYQFFYTARINRVHIIPVQLDESIKKLKHDVQLIRA